MSRTSLALLPLAAIVAAAPFPARAHGVVAQVERSDGAVAVRLRYHDGPVLAGAAYVVQSPRADDAPFAEGRTDRHGWVAFTPDVPGTWTVRIADASGHGKTVEVEVATVASAAPAGAARAGGAPSLIELTPQGGGAADGKALPPPDDGRSQGNTLGATLNLPRAFGLLAGATAILLVFRVLLAVQRARRGKGR